MIKETITLDETIEKLNHFLELDKEAMNQLINIRVECNNQLGTHPDIQVIDFGNDKLRIGLLGILNGLFGSREDLWGEIGIHVNDEDKLDKFIRTSTWKS